MVFQAEDRTKAKRQQAEVAIQLALQGKWADAVALNSQIIESFPTDVDAYNRLGKALTELGRYAEAREAYDGALKTDPLNTIAQKNLARLSTLGEAAPPKPAAQKLSPQMFIEETGKTGITTLARPDMKVALRMTAGDQVNLDRENGTLVVKAIDGGYVGEVEPKLGQRLVKLIDGGNEYVAAISALDKNSVRVFIRETFQHGSQTGKLSFPPTVTESFRPYVKERLLRQDADDDTFYEDADEVDNWDEGAGDIDEDDGDDGGAYDMDTGGPRISLDDEAEE
jgi:tetratricopeptide (TPR) repeat protein